MKWGKYCFGSITIDGKAYEQDVVLDQGGLRKRKKKPSREYRDQFGHTPVSLKEAIPWKCQRLLIGTGMHGRLPVMDEVWPRPSDAAWRSSFAPRRRPSNTFRKTRKRRTRSCM